MFKYFLFGCMPNLKTNRELPLNIIECICWNKERFRQLRLEMSTELQGVILAEFSKLKIQQG